MAGKAAAARWVLALLLCVRRAQSLSWGRQNSILTSQGCTELVNQGTHFSIDVMVGTPPQVFSVVADTGSNTLIVPSCSCQAKGRCPTTDRCFTGTNKSTTFQLLQESTGGPVSMVLSFGSGQIQGVIAKEKVRIGEVEHFMDDGLMLMTDRALNTQASRFEGILGLGVPLPAGATVESGSQETVESEGTQVPKELQDIIDKIMSGQGISADAPSANTIEEAMRRVARPSTRGVGVKGNKTIQPAVRAYEQGRAMFGERQPPKGFLEQAKIDRFSMCFNDGADGVLRIGTPSPDNAHGGVGKAHWGVDFRGISVGKNTTPGEALFCRPENMTAGQDTPCGAIPDSGTTLLMGPPDHVASLLETLCDQWDRCQKNYTALVKAEEKAEAAMTRIYGINPFNIKAMTKADVFQFLLMDCESWMADGAGLDELPSLHFHIVGSNGTNQALELTSHAYVMETASDKLAAFNLLSGMGNTSIPVNINSGNKTGRVCTPAFNTMEYTTTNNGPVWILGTPLFYEYVVGYDSSTDPPSMAFSSQKETPCGSCRKTTEPVNLMSTRGHKHFRRPRQLRKQPRMPNIDTTKPL